MGENILVTGGGGFLGSVVVRKLVERGDKVRIIGRNRYPDIEALGVKCIQGDIRNLKDVEKAAFGVDQIQHIAAFPGIWGSHDDYFSINVKGTRNVITTCRKLKIPRLVFTSSPSVVHGGQDIKGLSEKQLPYPESHGCPYSETKAISEKEVLEADNTKVDGGSILHTVALRPHLIWGPGDTNLIPRILQKARSGRLRIVGTGQNRVDTVYIDNAAEAQILAGDILKEDPSRISGKAYFITQDEPVLLWEFVNRILQDNGIKPLKKKISYKAAWTIGMLLETFHRIFLPSKEPAMTRFLAEQLATDHYFDISAAKNDLGYTPHVSTEEGLKKLKEYLQKVNRNK